MRRRIVRPIAGKRWGYIPTPPPYVPQPPYGPARRRPGLRHPRAHVPRAWGVIRATVVPNPAYEPARRYPGLRHPRGHVGRAWGVTPPPPIPYTPVPPYRPARRYVGLRHPYSGIPRNWNYVFPGGPYPGPPVPPPPAGAGGEMSPSFGRRVWRDEQLGRRHYDGSAFLGIAVQAKF